jgi:hypothetical protein
MSCFVPVHQKLRHPFHCYIVPRVIHHFPRCSCTDYCQLVARIPLTICNLWKSFHLHHMHVVNIRYHYTIFNYKFYKFSNPFYTRKHNFSNMSFLLMFDSCNCRYQSSLWAYILAISKTILPTIFSIFIQANKFLAYHNNFQLLIFQISFI